MPKIKDIILGILVIPIIIPVMVLASYSDQKKFKKELEQEKLNTTTEEK